MLRLLTPGPVPELMAGLVGYSFKEAEDAGVGTVIGSLIFNSLFIVGASVWVSPSRSIGIDPFSLFRDSYRRCQCDLKLTSLLEDKLRCDQVEDGGLGYLPTAVTDASRFAALSCCLIA